MRARAAAAAIIVAGLAPALAHGGTTGLGPAAYDPNLSYTYRILNSPKTGDAFMFRDALQGFAQQRSNKLFSTLASVLGGTAPTLNFVPTGSQFLLNEGHLSANGGPQTDPGSPQGTINVDPYAVESIINDHAVTHDGGLNQLPHEMAHLRQTPAVLADIPTREGGAQAFADLVAQTAADRAHIPNTLAQEPAGWFDGIYSDYVKQAQQRGPQWLLAGQFGKTGTAVWP